MSCRASGAGEDQRHRSIAGFTAIELLIVIVIFGVLTSVAMPTASRIISHYRVNQAATTVAHALTVAVSGAASARKPIRLAPGADNQSLTVSDRVSGTVVQTQSFGRDTEYGLDSLSFSVTPVDVFPGGFASSALTITAWARGYSRQVTMSRAGWVRAL
jgi:prepilin-type N-terminal cleavage/methylation domain-containing protein